MLKQHWSTKMCTLYAFTAPASGDLDGVHDLLEALAVALAV
jgi:hypothetical protein